MTKKLTIKGGPTSNSIKLLWGDVELNEFVEKIEFEPIVANSQIKAKLTVYLDELDIQAEVDDPGTKANSR